MPLRMLLYAAFYWERQWKAWEDAHPRGHTPGVDAGAAGGLPHGPRTRWRTHRELAELFVGPPELRPACARWPLLFWELAEHSTESLLGSASGLGCGR